MNWLDFFLLILLAAFVLEGVRQGFVRLAIGLAATFLGLFLAAWFYGAAGSFLLPYLSSPSLAHVAGFLLVFIAVQGAGALLGWALARLFKWTGLTWLDRALGAAMGVLKTALVGIVLVIVLTAFPIKPIPSSIASSQAAPYLIEASHILVYLCPRELRDGFTATYERIRDLWSGRNSVPGHRTAPLPRDSA